MPQYMFVSAQSQNVALAGEWVLWEPGLKLSACELLWKELTSVFRPAAIVATLENRPRAHGGAGAELRESSGYRKSCEASTPDSHWDRRCLLPETGQPVAQNRGYTPAMPTTAWVWARAMSPITAAIWILAGCKVILLLVVAAKSPKKDKGNQPGK